MSEGKRTGDQKGERERKRERHVYVRGLHRLLPGIIQRLRWRHNDRSSR